jgi:D-alanine-D-alanine ligase
MASCRDEATKTFRALSIRDVGRADMIVDAEGAPWVIDVNVSPGMTDTSLLPMAAAAAGVDLPELCDRVVQLPLARRQPR